jgi:uncharacterized protein YjbJ (UPF0337 family)
MNKDQVKGRVEDVKGKIKEGTAEVTGNERLKAEGQLDQAAGKTRAAYGDAKENVKDAVKKNADKILRRCSERLKGPEGPFFMTPAPAPRRPPPRSRFAGWSPRNARTAAWRPPRAGG